MFLNRVVVLRTKAMIKHNKETSGIFQAISKTHRIILKKNPDFSPA